MFSYFKDFLLNIFIIFFPLIFYPYVYKTKSKGYVYKALLFVLCSFALVLLMSFPVVLHGITHDFRTIPLVIGSLYGGPLVSLLLYLTLIVSGWFMDNPNNLNYAASILPSYALILFVLKGFPAWKLYQKILAAIFLCTCVKLLTFTSYFAMTDDLERLLMKPLATLQTYLLQGLIVGCCVYLIEFLNTYFQFQEEVVKSEKSKIVSEMAAAVAHEIRNPLTAVRGFIQLFGADDLDQQKRVFYQKVCLEELDRAQLIITDYLSLAKPDPEVIEMIHIGDELNYLSNVLLTYANYNDIQINRVLPEEEASIVGDRYKFRQALINIGKNAIEALNDGGILEMKASRLHDQVVIIISDNGVGMTAAQIDRLGMPYYSTKEKGTGLGTMVSFGIIKKMNGKIEISSEPGVGTEYKLIFPRAK